MAEGLWQNEAGRKISQILRKTGYKAAEFGKRRVSGRYPMHSGYRLNHYPDWRRIEVYFEIGEFDRPQPNERAELEKIKALLEAQDLAVQIELKDHLDYVKVTYKTPMDLIKERNQE